MPRDSSLTDFAASGGWDDLSEERGSSDGDGGGSADDTDGATGTDGVDGAGSTDQANETNETNGADEANEAGDEPAPARATYEWTPGGATCAVCGEQTTRRWRLDGDLVCPGCKTW